MRRKVRRNSGGNARRVDVRGERTVAENGLRRGFPRRGAWTNSAGQSHALLGETARLSKSTGKPVALNEMVTGYEKRFGARNKFRGSIIGRVGF
jgi:hypothetical protein